MHEVDLLTSDEVARRLRVDRSTVTRWAQSGRLPCAFKFDGRRGPRLFAADVVAQLEQEATR